MSRLLLISLLVGCLDSGKVVCDDGRICPPGYTCDDARSRCVSPEQQAACNGLAESAACEFSGAPGTCRAGTCEPLLCGDGVVGGNELCDGTDLAGATCATAGFYDAAGLACTAFCTYDTSACTGFCGDGVVNGPEQCDGIAPAGTCTGEGFDAGPLACGPSCGESFASCARFGWRPEPLGGIAATAIDGTGHTDQWVVGEQGRIVHFNGSNWTELPSGTTADLVAVASVSPTEAWAVAVGAHAGDPGSLLHYAGTWQVVAAPAARYTAIAAIDPSHVYFSTLDREIVWWNGAAMQTLAGPGGALTAIAGTSPTDLWAIASDLNLWHYDGAWHPATLGQQAFGITVVSAANVWVAAATESFESLVAHWDGVAWTTYTGLSSQSVYAIAASTATDDVWAASNLGNVLHFDGTGWVSTETTSDSELAIKSFGPGEVVGVSRHGLAYRYRGQAFGNNPVGFTTQGVGVWSDRADDTFVLASREVDHFDGGQWTKQLSGGNATFYSIWGSGPSDVWVPADKGLYHYDGTSWAMIAAPPPGQLSKVWGTSASDLWVGTSGGLFHGPGTWTQELVAPGQTTGISGSAANDVWAVQGGGLYHWDGAQWTAQTLPVAGPIAVSARTPSDVWVTSANAHVVHWDGATWTAASVPALADLRSIYAIAADDVVAASTLEMIHFDGRVWSPVNVGIDTSMDPIAQLYVPAPDRFAVLYTSTLPALLRELIRTRLWVCREKETDCHDAIDDDCDGLIDDLDPDCH